MRDTPGQDSLGSVKPDRRYTLAAAGRRGVGCTSSLHARRGWPRSIVQLTDSGVGMMDIQRKTLDTSGTASESDLDR